MTKQSDLVPLHMHNLLTAGPAPWTATRVPSEVWHVTRAVYGTSNEDDEKRAYRTVQAALWKAGITAASGQAEPQPEREPIPRVLFDGFSVLQALDPRAKARTSAENVSDVLDAVVKIMRAGIGTKGGDKP